MVRTRVGYTGGVKASPTYHDLGDHAEAIEIDYDPDRLSYEDLLEVFWQSHSPLRPAWKRQYMSAIFHHDAGQERSARATLAAQERRLGQKLHTEIAPASDFYRAEGYHQKYMLRRTGNLLGELAAIYPRLDDLVDSTSAARINGFVAGCGTLEQLRAELPGYGLSADGQRLLLKLVEPNHRRPA